MRQLQKSRNEPVKKSNCNFAKCHAHGELNKF